MLEGTEQKGAQPALLRVGSPQGILLEQVGEEPLGQVLRVVGRAPAAAQKGVERGPVQLTEVRQRPARGFG